MNYDIEYLSRKNIVYMRNIGAYGNKRNFELMKNFKEWIKVHGFWDKVEKNGIYGIARDKPNVVPEKKCRYDVMLDIETEIKSNEVLNGVFEGGKYIVFKVKHTNQGVSEFFTCLNSFLEKEGINTRNEPIIERYKEDEGEDKICEILIPVF